MPFGNGILKVPLKDSVSLIKDGSLTPPKSSIDPAITFSLYSTTKFSFSVVTLTFNSLIVGLFWFLSIIRFFNSSGSLIWPPATNEIVSDLKVKNINLDNSYYQLGFD